MLCHTKIIIFQKQMNIEKNEQKISQTKKWYLLSNKEQIMS